MRVFVIRLGTNRMSSKMIGIILSLIVLLSVSLSVVTTVFRKELFLQSAIGISDDKIIIIDPGHGGEDGGAVGSDGTLEKNLNLEIALLVGKQLENAGYVVVYTRTDDRMLYKPEENIKGIRKLSDLKNRCAVAANYPEAIFVSIHMNSFGNSKYSGLQVYYSENRTESRALADSIQCTVKNDLQKENDRVIKPGRGIYVLEHVDNTAVLIECGFLSNEQECKNLSEKEYQKLLSFSIVCGIIEYINN